MPTDISELKTRIDALYLEYVFPVLATVRIGEAPETVRFEQVLLESARAAGVKVRRYIFPETVEAPEIESLLRQAGADFLLSAILLERPLPDGWDGACLDAQIPPEKRLAQPVDGSQAAAAALLWAVTDAAERRSK